MRSILMAVSGVWLMAAVAVAQPAPDQQTLAGIRADLQILKGQIESLRRELQVADPVATGVVNAAPLIERTDLLDEEVRRLTSQVEALRFRIDQVVADGTNRIGDLEFRLTELEGGDFSTLGETVPLGEGNTSAPVPRPQTSGTESAGTSTDGAGQIDLGALRPVLRPDLSGLGGGSAVSPAPRPEAQSAGLPEREAVAPVVPAPEPATPAPTPQVATLPDPASGGPQLAVAEREDYQRALDAFNSGNYGQAAQGFQDFLANYPGGPLAGEAAFWRGEALAAQGDWSNAARSYLDSFSGAPQGSKAPESLYRLGVSLGRIGQLNEACLTLSEVSLRYPGAPLDLIQKTESERRALNCN
ncbi:tol-pal system protein YbgF [Halovulum sp. GXIMD14794]